ncbi:MAG: saccharopine dehydrogenase C-terminal domain-containing protein [Thermoplasmata archaeon]
MFGAGATGSVAASHLVRLKEIDELVLAEQFPERAQALASRLTSRKTRVVPVRGTDPGTLAKVIEGADLAINAAHVTLDLNLMEACLDAGANYMDLSSLPSKQFPFDARFKKAGLTALLGGGEDPGLGNVLARVGADGLETVDSIKIRDGDTAMSPDTPLPVVWSPETFLEEVFSPGLYFEDGKIVKVPPWSGREVYPFPEPVGPQPVYWMDHEEPETLGKFIGKGLKFADLKLAIDDQLFRTLNLLRELGVLGEESIEVDGMKVAPRKVLMRLLPRPTELIGKVSGTAMIVVEVEGWKDGERVVHRLYTGMKHEEAFGKYGATATGYLVGTGAAVFATQFTRGQIKQKGVIAAECLDPAESLRLMSTMGLKVVHETRSARGLN